MKDAAHQSFEHYVAEIKAKCKGKHKEDQKCQDCLLAMDLSYKVKEKCIAGHKPFPQGMCNKCLPQPVVLARQTYRHIDYVSFRNFPEMQGFVSNW